LGLVVITPNMVMRKHSAVIDKRFAVELYCHAREAERSVHFATRGSNQWTLFREYYSSEKMKAVNRVVQELKGLIPLDPPLVFRQHFDTVGVLWVLSLPVTHLANATKQTWTFRRDEVIFIYYSFKCLIELLPLWPAPPAQVLINLRLDLLTCQRIIRRHLHGVALLDKADDVEHFCQSDYFPRLKIEEVVGQA
jgi:hypothetical protein